MFEISIAQILGFFSFALGISTFYQKDDRRLKLQMVIFNLNHMLHFILLGAETAALSALLSAFRTVLSIKINSIKFAIFFIALSCASGTYMAETYLDFLPVIGTSIGTYALFMLKGIQMRYAFLLGAICWLANNIVVGSIGGMLLESVLICINIFTIIQLRTEDKENNCQLKYVTASEKKS